MKVFLTSEQGYEWAEITEEQLRFFNWLQETMGNQYLNDILIHKIDDIDFAEI